MASELINARELIIDIKSTISTVCLIAPYDQEWFSRMVDRENEIIELIAKQPTVDAVEVVHGRLDVSYMDEYYGEFADCLECGTDNILPCNYCRNCGAKMGGGDKE